MDNYSAVYRRLDKIKATIEQLNIDNKNLRKRLKVKTDPLQDEINKLQRYVDGYQQQADARERVLESISKENEHLKLSLQKLQEVGNPSTDGRADESDQTGMDARTSG